MGPILAQDNDQGVPELNWNVPLGTRTYGTHELAQGISAPIGIGPGTCCEPRRKSGEYRYQHTPRKHLVASK